MTASSWAIPEQAHPDFNLTKVALPAKYKTMGLAFLPGGDMALATTDYVGGGDVPAAGNVEHKIFIVSDVNGASPKLTEIANTWRQISGIVVAEGKLYVSDRDGFYEIQQLTAPAKLSENRRKILSWPDEDKWGPSGYSWHQWVFTPMYRQGFFYAPYSGSIRSGGLSDVPPTSARSGAFLKWNLDGTLENFAGGLRSPNGAAMDEATGDMMVADNQGSWLPSSTFALMKPGKFYGHKNITPNWAESLPYEPPIAWLPHGTVRASPSQPIQVKHGTYAGHWLLGDVNNPGLMRIAVDRVDDSSPANGAVFWFSKGFGISALNRMAYGPDSAIYIGTITSIAGNWPGNSLQDLYRLSPKGTVTAFEMKTVRSIKDGLEIEFTTPVNPATAVAGNFSLLNWTYTRSAGYGEGKGNDQPLTVSQTEVSADGKRVFLKISGLVKDRLIQIKTPNVKSAAGASVWNEIAWFTHNTVSARQWSVTAATRPQSRPSPLESQVSQHVVGSRLSVAIRAAGAWKAQLLSPDGSIVDAAAGTGAGRFEMSRGSRGGLHLLRISGREGTLVRKVLF